MSYLAKPNFQHPKLPRNALGLTRRDYEGAMSTLCAGCGHDSVSAALMEACFELDIPAHELAKMSGIGCSSKTPTYFLSQSHGFNAVHGRMPSVATGASIANTALKYIGVSGDGDTASIGLGQFAHAVRRQVDMLYVVENNGTYGLTKGQFSATNDRVSFDRRGGENLFDAIDLCTLAIQLGASFVARGFSGDKDQLVPLIKAGMVHKGFAFIDVISPCVTFNNHTGSTKSFDHVREHNATVMWGDFVPEREAITASYAEGASVDIVLHDDESKLRLHKIEPDYDPYDRGRAIQHIIERNGVGEVVTGVLYLDPGSKSLAETVKLTDAPLNSLGAAELCPGVDALEAINQGLR